MQKLSVECWDNSEDGMGKIGWSGATTTLLIKVVYTDTSIKYFSSFYLRMNSVDEVICIHNAVKGEILHKLE